MSAPDDDFLATLVSREREALCAAGLDTTESLVNWLPKRHEDRRSFPGFPFQPGAEAVCLHGEVTDTMQHHFGGKSFYEAVVTDRAGGVFGEGKISCRWFNMPFMKKVVAAGQHLVIHGKVKEIKGRLIMDHPEVEIIAAEDAAPSSIHLGRVVPVYRGVSGINQRRLREIIHAALAHADGLHWQIGAEAEREKADVIRAAHYPAEPADATAALRLLAREEFFLIQFRLLWRKKHRRGTRAKPMGRRMTLLGDFYRSLPFDLTEAQKRSIREIIADFRSPHPMNRLLQGDVGAGKTFVAMAAMLLAVDSGRQAVLMAPTQILAEQHFLTFRRWLEPLGVRVALKTGAKEESTHLEIEGGCQILIGTHALLYDVPEMRDVGLVVVDEQHKFGVSQRAALAAKGDTPDVLVMTATPIPRTLTMTLYGDLDVSLLDEKPPGRGKMITALRIAPKQSDVTSFVRGELEKGRQAYLVYPLVEEGAIKAESATEAFAKWKKRLPGKQAGLLHGKLKPEEKDAVMAAFRDGEIHALIATTVIEVGVDVPNANVMILHHAERFGLAQIHQLRGRVGRGGHTSYCVLLTDGKNPEALEKLRVIASTDDGFAIAEADLRLRGPGEVMGTRQSGEGDMRFPEFLADLPLVKEAQDLALRALAAEGDSAASL